MHKRVILAYPQNEVYLLKMSTKLLVLRPIIFHYRTEYTSLNSNDFPLYIYTFGTLSIAGVLIVCLALAIDSSLAMAANSSCKAASS